MASWAVPESSGGLCTLTGAIASRERELVRGRRQGRECFFFRAMNLKNPQQVRELRDRGRRLGKAVQHKTRAQIAGDFQPFHERGDSGAVHVFHAGHVNEELRNPLVPQERHQSFTDLRRVEEGDVATEVENGDFALLAGRELDWRTWGHRHLFCQRISCDARTEQSFWPEAGPDASVSLGTCRLCTLCKCSFQKG